MAGEQEPELIDGPHDGGPVKTFLEHLEDFRWVLIKSVVALILGMLICLLGANFVVKIIKWPLSRAPEQPFHHVEGGQTVAVRLGTNQVTQLHLTPAQSTAWHLGTNRYVTVEVEPMNLGTNQVLSWHELPVTTAAPPPQRVHVELVNLGPAGGFVVAFQVAIYGGALLSAPFIFYFIASFIFPALKLNERKHIFRALAVGTGLFVSGVAFCYFLLMPLALAAAQMYSNWLGLGAFEWRAEEYISFVCKFMLGMGLGFELPVVLLTLVKLDILNYGILSKARRYMIVINLILGAVLTTPEPITQLVMFVPLQFLYEFSVWVAWYWDQENRAAARRKLFLGALIVLAVGALVWLALTHSAPLLHHLRH